jgi:predicted phage terminase large subunit-like protein
MAQRARRTKADAQTEGQALAWRYYPDTFAEHASEGRWLRFRFLRFLGEVIGDAVALGGQRIIVNAHPRSGKSTLISGWTPVWYLDNWPDKNVILTSYVGAVAKDWGRKARNTLERNERCVTKLQQDSKRADLWHTEQGGGMLTAGVDGPVTGRGADLAIGDDLHKNWSEAQSETKRNHVIDWFLSDLQSRVEPDGTIILFLPRYHELDITGYLMEYHGDDWTHIRLPAFAENDDPMGRKVGEPLCPERFSKELLLKKKKETREDMFSAIWMQTAIPPKGHIFNRKWWKYYRVAPTVFDEVSMTIDCSFKDTVTSSFVAIQAWGRKGLDKYLLDEVHERMGFIDTLNAIVRTYEAWPSAMSIYIEEAANGYAVIETLSNRLSAIHPVPPRGSKIARAHACAPQIEAGHTYLPHPDTAPWVKDFIKECSAFPKSALKDRVDAMTQYMIEMMEHESHELGTSGVVTETFSIFGGGLNEL